MTMSLTRDEARASASGMTAEERKVILASSFGALMEWYDFYIYAALAVYFGALFFPKGNETAAFLASLATFGAGFLIRPVGALLFGRLGDLIGRKYTFLVTILLMGIATVGVGVLPTYEQIGIAATVLLVLLRLLQGLALGGEVGGAVTYVAEHSPVSKRGLYTSSLQTTATLGLLSSLFVVYLLKTFLTEAEFRAWGWRIPFIVSLVMLVISVYIRGKLHESPVFARMKASNATSKAPIRESFTQWHNLKFVLLLFVVAAGLGAIFGTGHFYTMFFVNKTLHVPIETVHMLIAIALVVATPCYLFFGWLSDRIGRKYIMMVACLLAALTIQPIFKGLTHYANPALEHFQQQGAVQVTAGNCKPRLFGDPVSDCDKIRGYLTDLGVGYTFVPASDARAEIRVGTQTLQGFDRDAIKHALVAAGWPERADPARINMPMLFLLLLVPILFLAMVYGPMAAFMVELFPARVRYTSLSLPFHLGAGWVGGMLSFVVTAMNVSSGDVYYGLWYPVIIAGAAFVIGMLFVPETRGRDLST
ncbi:MFS transporter [Cupriavidus numazuensis]|uniref:Sialic acid transporter NanT n=1 Tax=Cupriavidus numazuensis TaxID=221992 RepID=A0ABN7Q5R6_9BURK|nr:MFS transporter [Cupriavidus numazuensis]CAG2150461.1 Sialic acid transporter NanT [Cupriavidus numazuensis]